MRGRLLILIGLIVLLAIIAVVVILPAINQPTVPVVTDGTTIAPQPDAPRLSCLPWRVSSRPAARLAPCLRASA